MAVPGEISYVLAAPLTFDVQCRTNPRATRGKKHPMTIHPDWSVTTPHDLEAERVAVALGGYSSCLEIVDTCVPALRELLMLHSRRARPWLLRDPGWRLAMAPGCGCKGAFATAAMAADHARSPRHLAARFGCSERLLAMLVGVTGDAVRELAAPRVDGSGLRVREAGGTAELWDAGVHPDDAVAMAGFVPAVVEPLPVRYFLGAAYRSPSVHLLATASAARPDPDTASWLAWLDEEWVDRGEELAAWLRLGLPRGDVLDLAGQDRDPAEVAEVAAALRMEPVRVARMLAAWGRADCVPTGRHLRLLVGEGLEAYRPSAPAVDELVRQANSFPVERTELGVMLALADTRADVLAALARGVGSAAELVAESWPPVERGWRSMGEEAG